MTHLSIAVILLSILAFVVGFIFGVVLSSEDEYNIPRTNFDKFVQLNREELIYEIARNYCIEPTNFTHQDRDCSDCPFESKYHDVEHCISNTEEWLKQPYTH